MTSAIMEVSQSKATTRKEELPIKWAEVLRVFVRKQSTPTAPRQRAGIAVRLGGKP